MMAFGLVTITLCVGYLGYMHAMKENDQQLYEAIDSEGERYMRRKTSKWDWLDLHQCGLSNKVSKYFECCIVVVFVTL